MRLTYWVLIILLVLLLAAGVYLLTRKPSAPREDHEVSEYGPGGTNVAAGDAGVQQVSPTPRSAESSPTQEAPYDQEADQEEQQEGTSQEGYAETSAGGAAYTDTATGAEVPLQDETPMQDEATLEQQDAADGGQEEAVPAMARENETRTQQDTWVPVEPARVDKPHRESAEQPDERTAKQPDERTSERHDDSRAVTYGSQSEPGEDTVYAVPAHRAHDADNDPAGDDTPPTAFAAGSDDAPAQAATSDSDAGHPGPSSQQGDDADYALGEVGADSPGPESEAAAGSTAYPTAERTYQGFPGPESQPDDEAVHPSGRDEDYPRAGESGPQRSDEPVEDEVARPVDEPVEDEVARPVDRDGEQEGDAPTGEREAEPAWDEHDDDVPPDAAAAGFEPPPSPYGPGTALPSEDGSGPEGWGIKGNAGSMLFHTPDSPSYAESRAEVWFESEQAARAAGFAHWDRRRR